MSSTLAASASLQGRRQRLARTNRGAALAWIALWALLLGAALWLRPLWPIDETRYLSVAWEMWSRGDPLVPHLNGLPYSDKPPLLFWLIELSWSLFGVNPWTARLIAPLFALASLFLAAGLARRLWPGPAGRDAARLAPAILLGTALWAAFGTLTMFDMPLTFFTLLGMHGGLAAARAMDQGRRAWRGFALLGLAIGLGVLAKGPAILLHVLPAVVLAPLWRTPATAGGRWGRWYGGLGLAVLLGAAIARAWAIPAALAGGSAYREAILWGQTAGRMAHSFAHAHPFWWYLPLLPLLLAPWVLWPRLWRALPALRGDAGARFCLAWALPVFLAFSLISGKQAQYLLPIFPPLALLAARALSIAAPAARRGDGLGPALFFAVLGAALVAVPLLAARLRLPEVVGDIPLWTGLAVLALALAVAVSGWRAGVRARRPATGHAVVPEAVVHRAVMHGAAAKTTASAPTPKRGAHQGDAPDAEADPAGHAAPDGIPDRVLGGIPGGMTDDIPGGIERAVYGLSLAGVGLVLAASLGVIPALAPAYDLAPLAARLQRYEREGRPLAYAGGKYHGQFQFLGRLQRPLAVIPPKSLPAWLAVHPDGRAVLLENDLPPGLAVRHRSDFRSRSLVTVGGTAAGGAR